MSALQGTRVSLVFPDYKSARDPVFLNEATTHIGVIPPLSLAGVASILEREGCAVEIIDASAMGLSKSEVAGRLSRFRPDFVGYTTATYQFGFTLDWIRTIKETLDRPVIVGGTHGTLFPRETLQHAEIDYVVTGDAEETLPEFLGAVVEGESLKDIKGICFRNGDDIVLNETRDHFSDLDSAPFPSRHLLDNRLYYSLISRKRNFTAMITSRGCPFQCIYCQSAEDGHRYRGAKSVVDEMEECSVKYDVREIDIFDATFTLPEQRAFEICDEIEGRGLELTWSFRTRADLVSGELLSRLKKSGCVRIFYGIESGNAEILRNVRRYIPLEKTVEAIRLTRDNGIETFGFFVIGLPGETRQSVRSTIDIMRSLDLDYVQVSPLFTPPRTELYGLLKRERGVDFWADYTVDLEERILPRYGTSLTDHEIKQYCRKAYLKFYMRPGYIVKKILAFRSAGDLKQSALALSAMLLSYLLGFFRGGRARQAGPG